MKCINVPGYHDSEIIIFETVYITIQKYWVVGLELYVELKVRRGRLLWPTPRGNIFSEILHATCHATQCKWRDVTGNARALRLHKRRTTKGASRAYHSTKLLFSFNYK